VELFLHEMMPDQVVRRLHGRQIGVGFLYLPFDDSALDFRPVSREPLVVALPETHPLAQAGMGTGWAQPGGCRLEGLLPPAPRITMPTRPAYGQEHGPCSRLI
jgi:DNA-binding transcriptional LysR family regulator